MVVVFLRVPLHLVAHLASVADSALNRIEECKQTDRNYEQKPTFQIHSPPTILDVSYAQYDVLDDAVFFCCGNSCCWK